jgi:hypothetical protein
MLTQVSPLPWDSWAADVAAVLTPGIDSFTHSCSHSVIHSFINAWDRLANVAVVRMLYLEPHTCTQHNTLSLSLSLSLSLYIYIYIMASLVLNISIHMYAHTHS